MEKLKAILNILAQVITVVVQLVLGFVAAYIFFAEGYGNILYMWIGITLSVFIVGIVSTIFRGINNPKIYLLRLGLTALAVALVLVIFYFTPLYFYNADYEMPPEIPFLATIAG